MPNSTANKEGYSRYGCTFFILLITFAAFFFGTAIFWLINAFAVIGTTLILAIDYTASPLLLIGVSDPRTGWLILGCLLGSFLGLIQGLKRIGRSSDLPKVYIVAAIIFILLQIFAYLNVENYTQTYLRDQFNTSAFQKVVLPKNSVSQADWQLTDGSSLHDGKLFQLQPKINWSGWSVWEKHSFRDVDYRADVIKVDGPNDTPFGLLARVNGENDINFYYLLIRADGMFAMGEHSKAGWDNRVGWIQTDTIKPTGKNKSTNQLRIICRNKLIVGFINGKMVGYFRDISYLTGKIAVYSSRAEEKAVAVYFDNMLALTTEKEL